MDQNAIQMLVEELGDGGPPRMTAQNHQRRLGLCVTLGINHAMYQGHQFGPHLLPDRCGHITSGGRRSLGGSCAKSPAKLRQRCQTHRWCCTQAKVWLRKALRPWAPSLVTPRRPCQSRPARRARSNRCCQGAAWSSRSATIGGHSTPVTLSAKSNTTRVAPPRSRAHRPSVPTSSLWTISCNCPGTLACAVTPARSTSDGRYWRLDNRVRPAALPPQAAICASVPDAPATSAETPPCAAKTSAHVASDPPHCGGPPGRTNCRVPAAPIAPSTTWRRRGTDAVAPAPARGREKPGLPHVAAVLDRQSAPACRTLLPVPRRPPRQPLQRLQKRLAVFYNVHGLGDSLCGFLTTTAWSHGPFLSKYALPNYQQNLEPNPK